MVCNFLVVITTLFRLLFRRKRDGESVHNSGDSGEGENYNSGERVIGLGATTHTRTQAFTFTTISTHLSHDVSAELEEFQRGMHTFGRESRRSLDTSVSQQGEDGSRLKLKR